MSMPRLPWFGWAIVAFVVLNVVLDRDVALFPLIIIGFVLASVIGSQRRPRRQVPQPHDPPQGQPYDQPLTLGQPSTPTAEPMPTIDVPRYPGTPASSIGTDPTVSFAQLQLGEAGRALEHAAASGNDAGVEQALHRMQATVSHVRPALEGLGSRPSRTLRASLDGIGAATTQALSQPPGPRREALVERIVATCRTAY